MIIIIIIAIIAIIAILILLFGLYFNDKKTKLLLYGNMKTSNCIYTDLSDDNDKDKIKIDDPHKNMSVKVLVGKYGIKEIHINSLSLTILYNSAVNDVSITQTINDLNKIYGNNNTYISAIKDKNNTNNTIIYTIINKNKFIYFKKSENSSVEIPDIDFYIYGHGEPPICV